VSIRCGQHTTNMPFSKVEEGDVQRPIPQRPPQKGGTGEGAPTQSHSN
jgi:hypothetical protein